MENKCNMTTSKPETQNTNVYRSVALPSHVACIANWAAYLYGDSSSKLFLPASYRKYKPTIWPPTATFYTNVLKRHDAISSERERELDREYEREKQREIEERRARYGPGTRWEILKRLCE